MYHHNIIPYVATANKGWLIEGDERVQCELDTISNDFLNALVNDVAARDGPEVSESGDRRFLRDQGNDSAIDIL